MRPKTNPRPKQALARQMGPGVVIGEFGRYTDRNDTTLPFILEDLAARRIAHRCGFSAPTARAIAELAGFGQAVAHG